MHLIEKTLFDTVDKVTLALERLQERSYICRIIT